MRTIDRCGVLAVLAASAAATLAAQRGEVWTFDADATGAAPPGFTLAAMRQASPGAWLVRDEAGLRVLSHGAEPAATGYALAIAPGEPRADVLVSVRLRLAGGRRVGGLVWRYQDAHNYYAAVLDLGDGSLSMYRVAGGNRVALERRSHLELDANAWHTLKVVHDDEAVFVSLGGIRVIEERDRRFDRLGPGLSGVVAGGDADVWFDDLRIEPDRDRR
jgi:hypothetical protein